MALTWLCIVLAAPALEAGASYRVSAGGMTALTALDAQGTQAEPRFVEHRLELLPALVLSDRASVRADLQLSAGLLARRGVPERLRAFWPAYDRRAAELQDAIMVRKLFLDWRTPVGVLRLGRMSSSFGLGILAHGGEEVPPGQGAYEWGTPRAGADLTYGDIVERVLLATTPLTPLTQASWASRFLIALGVDRIVRDERTSRALGDHALQGVAIARYTGEVPERDELAIYVAYRESDDRSGESLDVWAYDLFGRGALAWGDVELYGTGEVALMRGETTLGRAGIAGPLTLQQLGYVARAGARFFGLAADLELAYASGDSNPYDPYVRNFTFDPDYNPSLLLFEERRAGETAAAAARAADPTRVGEPSSAVRFVPTVGGVTNAVYLKPTVRYAAGPVSFRAALLWARAAQPVVDPSNTFLAGGAARNHQGAPARALRLGVEADVGVDVTWELAPLTLLGSLEGGRLWPGPASRLTNGTLPRPVNAAFVKVLLRWRDSVTMGH